MYVSGGPIGYWVEYFDKLAAYMYVCMYELRKYDS